MHTPVSLARHISGTGDVCVCVCVCVLSAPAVFSGESCCEHNFE